MKMYPRSLLTFETLAKRLPTGNVRVRVQGRYMIDEQWFNVLIITNQLIGVPLHFRS